MTIYQIQLSEFCPYDGEVLNHAASKGNGKEKEYCNRECYRKYYVINRILENLYQQFNLLEGKFEQEGELTQQVYEFMILARELLEFGLAVVGINPHLHAIRKNKSMIVKNVFMERIAREKKRLNLCQ